MWDSREQTRLAAVMYVRGFAVLALGAIGVRWPEEGLWAVIGVAGVIVTLLGVVELVLALRSTADRAVTSLLRYIALVSVAFGFVSFAATEASPHTAVAGAATWLLAQSVVSLMVGAVLRRPADRRALLTWSSINLLAALVVAAASVSAFYGLLYAGAGYTALYGIMQIAAGLRLRAGAIGFIDEAPARGG